RRMAPAWPVVPPPDAVTVMSNLSVFWVSSSGWRTIMRAVSRPKNSSSGRPLTLMLPLPLRRKTRATEDLRRPVPKLWVVNISDIQDLWLLDGVRVLGAGIDLERAVHGASERVLGQHALHRGLDHALGVALQRLAQGLGLEVADVAGEAVVLLVGQLVAGDGHLLRVDHDDVVAGVHVRGVDGL